MPNPTPAQIRTEVDQKVSVYLSYYRNMLDVVMLTPKPEVPEGIKPYTEQTPEHICFNYISTALTLKEGTLLSADLTKEQRYELNCDKIALLQILQEYNEIFQPILRGEAKVYKIIVNQHEMQHPRATIDAHEISELCGFDVFANPSITYSKGPKENPEGTLLFDDKVVYVQDGMIFNCLITNGA